MSVKDIDKGWKELKREVRAIKNARIEVGVIGSQAQSRPYDGPLTIADVATFNEFGTVNAPARSFIRSTFDENQNYVSYVERKASLLTKGVPARTILKIIGTKIKQDVVAKINNLRVPPNAASTIARKKSSNPLIENGRLKQSISYRIKK